MGLAEADFVLLAEEAGRAALPEPLIEQAALAVPALLELAAEPAAAALLPRLASGERAHRRHAPAESAGQRCRPALRTGSCARRRAVTLARAAEITAVAGRLG